MNYARDMIFSHPRFISEPKKDVLIGCIQACYDCAQSCTSCSDACLGERDIEDLKPVIRLTEDCAEICSATARILSRLNNPDYEVLGNQVQACITAARHTGALCTEHGHHHEHCRINAESCRACENACTEYFAYIENKR
ncbi:MAG: four-helix bundle copper-binding protein [Chitinispirillaceae bacterium]